MEWHLLTGTLADWVLYFIRKLSEDEEGRENEECIPFDLYYRCMDLCDRLILDYEVGISWLSCLSYLSCF